MNTSMDFSRVGRALPAKRAPDCTEPERRAVPALRSGAVCCGGAAGGGDTERVTVGARLRAMLLFVQACCIKAKASPASGLLHVAG